MSITIISPQGLDLLVDNIQLILRDHKRLIINKYEPFKTLIPIIEIPYAIIANIPKSNKFKINLQLQDLDYMYEVSNKYDLKIVDHQRIQIEISQDQNELFKSIDKGDPVKLVIKWSSISRSRPIFNLMNISKTNRL